MKDDDIRASGPILGPMPQVKWTAAPVQFIACTQIAGGIYAALLLFDRMGDGSSWFLWLAEATYFAWAVAAGKRLLTKRGKVAWWVVAFQVTQLAAFSVRGRLYHVYAGLEVLATIRGSDPSFTLNVGRAWHVGELVGEGTMMIALNLVALPAVLFLVWYRLTWSATDSAGI